MMRIGHGYDVHAYGEGDSVVLGGVQIPSERGLIAHSDGDVVLHALCDALLGAAGLGRRRSCATLHDASRVLCRYRAPEILLGATNYDKGVDMWAVGCIVAEMFIGKPLLPGKHALDQLRMVIELLGIPSDDELAALPEPEYAAFVRSPTARPAAPRATRRARSGVRRWRRSIAKFVK